MSSRESKNPASYLQNYPWWQVTWFMLNGLWLYFVPMVTQILVTCTPFETFEYLSSTRLKFNFLLDWYWRCFSCSKSNGIVTQKSNRATLNLRCLSGWSLFLPLVFFWASFSAAGSSVSFIFGGWLRSQKYPRQRKFLLLVLAARKRWIKKIKFEMSVKDKICYYDLNCPFFP